MSTSARCFRSLALTLTLCGSLACGGKSGGPGGTSTGSGNAGSGSQAGAAGSNGSGAGGSAAGTGQAGDSGGTGQAGDNGSGTGGSTTGGAGSGAGTAGSSGAGTAGSTGAAGAATGAAGVGAAGAGAAGAGAGGTGVTTADPCNTPPWRPLHVTATAALHNHAVGPGGASFDGRIKALGKLVVGMDVSGDGPPGWVVQRGYHGLGSSFPECNAPNLDGPNPNRDAVGNCRLMTEWGKIKVDTLNSIKTLAASNPEEDWGYFLTQDGTDVRWSDVAFTGASHGATTAEIIGRLGACIWRAVSCAGPRDNLCGKPPFTLPYNPASPPFDPNCPANKIASWLDMPSKTPMDRFYVIDGVTDGEYGDIMFNVNYTKYPGQPVQFDVPNPVLTGTNRFISMGGGHLNFVTAAETVRPMNTDAVLNIAFAIPPENQH